jgi:hypothetical protein
MIALVYFVLAVLASQFKSKSRLAAENAALRHQLIVLRRKVRGRAQMTNSDRWFFIQLYRWFPLILEALTIIRPETLVRWHRTGFTAGRWRHRMVGSSAMDRSCEPGSRDRHGSWTGTFACCRPDGAGQPGEAPFRQSGLAIESQS